MNEESFCSLGIKHLSSKIVCHATLCLGTNASFGYPGSSEDMPLKPTWLIGFMMDTWLAVSKIQPINVHTCIYLYVCIYIYAHTHATCIANKDFWSFQVFMKHFWLQQSKKNHILCQDFVVEVTSSRSKSLCRGAEEAWRTSWILMSLLSLMGKRRRSSSTCGFSSCFFGLHFQGSKCEDDTAQWKKQRNVFCVLFKQNSGWTIYIYKWIICIYIGKYYIHIFRMCIYI